MDSQADTYIEECFEQKCSSYKNFRKILNQWRKDKDIFSSCTSITNFDFQHYSMHDKTHSIAILQNIEMILGRERVAELNASNLWLLLEIAYCHDIGMSVTYKELCSIWESEDFQNFIIESLDSELADTRKASMFYEKLNALVHNKTQLTEASQLYDFDEFDNDFDELFGKKSWPVIGERYIMMLYTEYIRKLHPELSMNRILRYASNNRTDHQEESIIADEKKIPPRMYRAAALVAFLHGKDFDDIFRMVLFEENGFPGERMHPRFAAAMLRLGDLLDMDNNRFNIRMLNHMGLVPMESMLHLKKHQAITHLSYSPEIIEAEARSEEFEVCKTVQQWFDLLDEEVKNLICFWNKIVPNELLGCKLNCCDLKIYYNHEQFDASRQTKFVADSAQVYKMLIGNNIYKTRLDFIREYLQNAMDASKMQLWLHLKTKKEFRDISWESFTPYDIKSELYEAYKLEIEVDIDWDKQEISISFQDHGIGMEKDCVVSLSHIADDSWKNRKTYAKEIPLMPMWLRPTGGFGIGVQSAFMITNRVEFITKTRQESCGRKICMENRNKGGKVSEFAWKDAKNGTTVFIKIPIMNFIETAMEQGACYMKDVIGDIYDRNEISEIVISVLRNYIKRTAAFSMFPITLHCSNGIREQITDMQWLFQKEDNSTKRIRMSREIKLSETGNDQWLVRYAVFHNRFLLWDSKNQAIVIYTYNDEPNHKNSCYYKGIHINDEDFNATNHCSLEINYFDYGVSNYLTINRDRFCQSCQNKFKEDITRYKNLYAQMLAADTKDENLIDCNITNELGMISLIYNALGMLHIDEETYAKIVKNVTQKISVKKTNKCDTLQFLYDWKDKDFLHPDTHDHIFIPENILFTQEKISFETFISDIKTNPYFFYDARKEKSPTCMPTYHFANNILKPKQTSNDESVAVIPKNEDDICNALKNRYIVTDPEICLILQNHSIMISHVDIKEDNYYMMRIAAAIKKPEVNTTASKSIKQFLKNNLKEEIIKGEAFPIVLRTSKITEDDLQYHLWVKQIFGNTNAISLDNQKISASDRYLILPITQSTWMSILNIIRINHEISVQAYNELVKQRSELKLLIDWTYTYQDNEPRLKKDQIYEQYEKLLDLIYTEYVSDIYGEFYYDIIPS